MTGETCHCGKPLAYGYDGDPTHTRGMCEHCDAVRCDAYPGECDVKPADRFALARDYLDRLEDCTRSPAVLAAIYKTRAGMDTEEQHAHVARIVAERLDPTP